MIVYLGHYPSYENVDGRNLPPNENDNTLKIHLGIPFRDSPFGHKPDHSWSGVAALNIHYLD